MQKMTLFIFHYKNHILKSAYTKQRLFFRFSTVEFAYTEPHKTENFPHFRRLVMVVFKYGIKRSKQFTSLYVSFQKLV